MPFFIEEHSTTYPWNNKSVSSYLVPHTARSGGIAVRIGGMLSRIELRAAFRMAGPRIFVALIIWTASFGAIQYYLSPHASALTRSVSPVAQATSTKPAPLPSTPALELVADAQPVTTAPAPSPVLPASPAPAQSQSIYMAPTGTYPNQYDWGQCTWYVAGRREVPASWGNANTWYSRAKAEGWAVGAIPIVGAIAWTSAGYYGHVALVEHVSANGLSVDISEMNFQGLDIRDSRWVSTADFSYIYQ